MKFQIFKNGKHWYFRIVANNQKILCHSAQYNTKRGAMHAVQLIKDGADLAMVEMHVK